jgi:hypothetical protein
MIRRLIFVASVMWCVQALALTPIAPKATEPPTERAVEMTFFKSTAGQKENLKKFIMANWFAYHKEAVKQGLMVRFQLLDNPEHKPDWDVLVIVTYTNNGGYAGIKDRFDEIRSAHKVIAIEGEVFFKKFGAIVDSKRVFEVLGENSLH